MDDNMMPKTQHLTDVFHNMKLSLGVLQEQVLIVGKPESHNKILHDLVSHNVLEEIDTGNINNKVIDGDTPAEKYNEVDKMQQALKEADLSPTIQ